jgi:hypothetical protein
MLSLIEGARSDEPGLAALGDLPASSPGFAALVDPAESPAGLFCHSRPLAGAS